MSSAGDDRQYQRRQASHPHPSFLHLNNNLFYAPTPTHNYNNNNSHNHHHSGVRKRLLLAMLSFLFLVTMLVPGAVNAVGYTNLCPLSEALTPVERNPVTGEFTVANMTGILEGILNNDTSAVPELRMARRCPCSSSSIRTNTNPFFCFQGDGDYCGVSRDQDAQVACFHMTSRVVFIRNAWPVVILWYGALLIFLVATENGRNARDYVLSCCVRTRNDVLAERVVRREVRLRDQMRTAAVTQQRRVMELARVRREEERRTLVLKTTRYCRVVGNNNEGFTTPIKKKESPFTATPETLPNTPQSPETSTSLYPEDEVTCTICIGSIDEGDRIGSLSCNHLFHSDCLKEWIKRRNVCPLCQEPDIASPRPNPPRTNNTNDNDDDDNNDNDNDTSTHQVLDDIQEARRRLEEVAVAISNWRGSRNNNNNTTNTTSGRTTPITSLRVDTAAAPIRGAVTPPSLGSSQRRSRRRHHRVVDRLVLQDGTVQSSPHWLTRRTRGRQRPENEGEERRYGETEDYDHNRQQRHNYSVRPTEDGGEDNGGSRNNNDEEV